MARQAVILAGGKGTRLGSLTRTTPKPLLSFGGRPFIEHLIQEVARFGFRDVVLLVGPFREVFRDTLGSGEDLGVRLHYVPEPSPAGTGGALSQAANLLAPEFLFLNGDSFLDFNILDLFAEPRQETWVGGIALCPVADTGRYGTVACRGERVTGFSEKATGGQGLINAGLYRFRRSVLDWIGPPPASLEHDVLPRLAESGLLYGRRYSGRFVDIGMPTDFERADRLLRTWRRRAAAFIVRDGVSLDSPNAAPQAGTPGWTVQEIEAVRTLNDRGFLVFVLENPPGAAPGRDRAARPQPADDRPGDGLDGTGAHVDAFYRYPASRDRPLGAGGADNAPMGQEPDPIRQALAEWPIDLKRSFLIANEASDVAAALLAGLAGFERRGSDLKTAVDRALAVVPGAGARLDRKPA